MRELTISPEHEREPVVCCLRFQVLSFTFRGVRGRRRYPRVDGRNQNQDHNQEPTKQNQNQSRRNKGTKQNETKKLTETKKECEGYSLIQFTNEIIRPLRLFFPCCPVRRTSSRGFGALLSPLFRVRAGVGRGSAFLPSLAAYTHPDFVEVVFGGAALGGGERKGQRVRVCGGEVECGCGGGGEVHRRACCCASRCVGVMRDGGGVGVERRLLGNGGERPLARDGDVREGVLVWVGVVEGEIGG